MIRVRTQHFVKGQRSANVGIVGLDQFQIRACHACDCRYSCRELLNWLLSLPPCELMELGDFKRDGITLFWLES